MRVRTGFATPALRDERMKARWTIIQEVNKYKMRSRIPMFTRARGPAGQGTVSLVHYVEPKLFGIRHIQQAVNIARRMNLVSKETLQKAGYNA